MLYASFDNTPGSDSLIIKLNNGIDYQSPSIRVPAFESKQLRPYQVRAADINKDGSVDLLFNHTDMDGMPTDTLYYMLGSGHAQFDDPVARKMPDKVAFIALADVNADQWADLVVSCTNRTINVSLNHPVRSEYEEKLIQVYPNPVTTLFYIKAPLKTAHTVRVYNAAGQLIGKSVNSGQFCDNGIYTWFFAGRILPGNKGPGSKQPAGGMAAVAKLE